MSGSSAPTAGALAGATNRLNWPSLKLEWGILAFRTGFAWVDEMMEGLLLFSPFIAFAIIGGGYIWSCWFVEELDITEALELRLLNCGTLSRNIFWKWSSELSFFWSLFGGSLSLTTLCCFVISFDTGPCGPAVGDLICMLAPLEFVFEAVCLLFLLSSGTWEEGIVVLELLTFTESWSDLYVAGMEGVAGVTGREGLSASSNEMVTSSRLVAGKFSFSSSKTFKKKQSNICSDNKLISYWRNEIN